MCRITPEPRIFTSEFVFHLLVLRSVQGARWLGPVAARSRSWFLVSALVLLMLHQRCFFSAHAVIRFRVLQVEANYVLELSNKKTRLFLVLIALTWWFSEHTRKLFGEILVRT
jgi:hypothetical protein